jgi:hypothetical protein
LPPALPAGNAVHQHSRHDDEASVSDLIKGGRVVTAADDYVGDVFGGGEVGHFVERARFGETLAGAGAAVSA